MLIIKKVNAQKYTIAPAGGLRDESLKKLVWDHAKHQSGYLFCGAYRNGSWDGRIQVYKPTNVRAGYLQETLDHLNRNDIPWQWYKDELPEDLPLDMGDNKFTYEEFHDFCTKLITAVKPKFAKKYDIDLEVRDYQIDTAWKFINKKIGIAEHATSAGKSLTIAFILGFLFYKNAIEKAVILVPLQSLVTQFYGDLLDFGFKKSFIGKLYSGTKQTTRPITIAMNPSTKNIIGTLEEPEFFDNIDLVICDEVHKAASKTVTESVLRFHHGKYFFGCTGTLPEDPLNKEIIHSLFGEVLDTRKFKELKDDYDAVTNVKVGMLNFCYGMKGLLSRAKTSESHMDWTSEVSFLQNDFEFRNPYIVETILNNFDRKKNIVTLVKNIEYGLKMYHKIKEDSPRTIRKDIYWIDGSMPLKERDEIIQKCKKSKKPYIIVTNFQVFSTGINLPNISSVFLIDAGKSKITVAQTIGRGIRKSKNKSDVLIVDCACDLKYGAKHARNRKKLYREEGFEVYEKVIYDTTETELEKKIDSLR